MPGRFHLSAEIIPPEHTKRVRCQVNPLLSPTQAIPQVDKHNFYLRNSKGVIRMSSVKKKNIVGDNKEDYD
jgi:hypothetical protein